MKNTIGRYVTPVYFFSHILVQNGCVMNLEADKKDFSNMAFHNYPTVDFHSLLV